MCTVKMKKVEESQEQLTSLRNKVEAQENKSQDLGAKPRPVILTRAKALTARLRVQIQSK